MDEKYSEAVQVDPGDSDILQAVPVSNFDPNAVPMLIQCLKACIGTRNKQQQTANIVGRGESASVRGAVAQQALQYLVNNMSPEDLGNLGMFQETFVNSFGALGQSTRNASANMYSNSPMAQRIGQGFNSGYNQASSSLTNAYNSPTAQRMNQGLNQGIGQARNMMNQGSASLTNAYNNSPTAQRMNQGYGQARNMASQGYNQASAAAGRFGNMASNFFTRRQGQGGRKKRRTRRHKKR